MKDIIEINNIYINNDEKHTQLLRNYCFSIEIIL